MIFAAYVGAFTPLGDLETRAIAIAAMIVLAAANYRSLGWSAAIQNASAGAKVVALVLLGLAAFLFGNSSGALTSATTLAPAGWAGFGIALIAIMWTYDGWADITYIAGEIRVPIEPSPGRW